MAIEKNKSITENEANYRLTTDTANQKTREIAITMSE